MGLAVALSALAAPAAHAATCGLKPWTIVGVRGSGEKSTDDVSGMGTRVGKAYRAAVARLEALGVASSQIGSYPLNYPAVPVTGWHIINFTTGAYADSVRQGTVALGNYLQSEVPNCPSTKFILIGYSQGAQVIHQYLDAAPDSVVNRVTAMLLMSDPLGWVGTYQHGIDPTTGQDVGELGLGGSLANEVLESPLAERSLVVCFTNDAICANKYSPLSLDADIYLAANHSSHTIYGTCCSKVDVATYWGRAIARMAFGLKLQSSAATGAVVDLGNTARMFVRGTDAEDHEKYLSDGASSWHAFTGAVGPSGTTVVSDPTAVVDHHGTIHVFVRGADRKLYVRTHTSSGWDDFKSLGGIINGRPRAVVDSKNTVRVYVLTSNNTVDEISLANGSSTWSAYYDMGLVTTHDAVPIVDDQDIVRVYAVDGNSFLRESSLPLGGAWSAWADLGYWPIIDAPMPIVDGSGIVRVYILDAASNIYEKSLAVGGTWSTFWNASTLSNGFILYSNGDAVPFVDSEGTIRIYAGNSDGTLRERHLEREWGATWSSWVDLGSGVKRPVAAEEDLYGTLHVFTHSTSNTLGISTLEAGDGWTGIENQSGETLP